MVKYGGDVVDGGGVGVEPDLVELFAALFEVEVGIAREEAIEYVVLDFWGGGGVC